jgi:hypothetical protein
LAIEYPAGLAKLSIGEVVAAEVFVVVILVIFVLAIDVLADVVYANTIVVSISIKTITVVVAVTNSNDMTNDFVLKEVLDNESLFIYIHLSI